MEFRHLKNIFEYDNYRVFLNDLYSALKASDKKFSFRYFARVAGFNSHNFLRQVMLGQSNLSEDSIKKFSKAFKFSIEEAKFFKNLVLFNQAKTQEEKQAYAEELLRSKEYQKIHPLHESQFRFFKHWYYSVVRELVGLPGFREDPQWIAKRTIPPLSEQEAREALKELVVLGFLKREQGKLVQTNPRLTTGNEVASSYVSSWHKEYIKKAADSIERIPRQKRDISAISFGFSKSGMAAVKEIIQKFRQEIIDVASKEPNKDALYQLNIQIFPLAEVDSDES